MYMANKTNPFRERFKERLRAVKMTQVALGEKIGVESAVINQWTARQSVPVDYIFIVCELLRCDPRWLLSGAEPVASADKATRLALISESVNKSNRARTEAAKPSQVAETIAKLIQLPQDSLTAVDGIIDQILIKKNYE